jgi:hypothetical protein
LLKRFQMDNCIGISTPMDPNCQLEAALPGYTAPKGHLLEYQQVIRSIMYAMLGTRPDLTFTISTLSKYCSNPTPEHAIAAKRTLRYLRKTINVGITFRGQENPAIAEAGTEAGTEAGIEAGARASPTTTGITGFTDSD